MSSCICVFSQDGFLRWNCWSTRVLVHASSFWYILPFQELYHVMVLPMMSRCLVLHSVSNAAISQLALVFANLLNKKKIMVHFICFSLIFNEVPASYLMYVYCPCVYPLQKRVSSCLLLIFFNELFTLLIDFRNSLYILYIRTVNLQYYVTNIFSWSTCYCLCECMFMFCLPFYCRGI